MERSAEGNDIMTSIFSQRDRASEASVRVGRRMDTYDILTRLTVEVGFWSILLMNGDDDFGRAS